MTNLPVREMVLYKHGVGFFVRQGAVSGDRAQLTFRKDEINDILKSLAVFDQAGGQVLGILYQTPMDREARLASSSIRLKHPSSLRDLLRDLRGRDCTLRVETTPGTIDELSGRIIGLDEMQVVEEYIASVTLLTETGVHVFPLQAVRSFSIGDDQSANDLRYFLDTSMAEDDRRTVTVQLSEGEHDLAVYYVAPSPTWRVSYRLVAESDEDGSTGLATLQGWGLFDNRLDEDLEAVRLTLVAGQPISFIYDLYASRIPQRPTVQDESRVAPGPIEFAGAAAGSVSQPSSEAAMDYMQAASTYADAPPGPPAMLRQAAPAPRPSRQQAQAQTAQAEGQATGETFQYVVTAPVSVKRGESALVPIINNEVRYERELLYNGAKLPDHPVAALRFENTTGLTLERGPVTVVEDGDYKGEAVIPFSNENQQVYLPYAVELGIKVTQHRRDENVTTGVSFERGNLIEQQYQITHYSYDIENNTQKNKVVTLEAPVYKLWEVFETPDPAVETASERRWRVDVPARSKVTFTHRERRRTRQQIVLRNLRYHQLQKYLEQRVLSEALGGALRGILDRLQQKADTEATIQKLNTERESIHKEQEQLRANLGALQPTGQEATLRNRFLGQLESTQDRLDAIASEIAEAQASIKAADAQIEERIAALSDAT